MAVNYNFNDPALQGILAAAGPIMDTPRQAAVMPMTQQAVAPDYLSMLAGLDLSGLGGFGGGRMGGVIQDPNIEYITAPISNKGNPTGRMGGNVFAVTPDQPVRLVDLRTNQVVFEGAGADAARKATELGQNLTDTLGRKANYDIQTADPSGSYITVANEKYNKSTLGKIADVAGTLLPLAAIPLTAGASAGSLLASTAGKIGLGAALGGAGSALKGDDILKGAALGGLSAGIVSGTGLDKALGGVLGDIGGTLAGKTAEEAAKRATGDIVVTGLSKALQGAGGALGQAALSQAGNAASRALSGYQTPAEKFAQQPLPEAFQLPADMYAGLDPINVIGNRAVPSYGGALSGVFEPIATEFLPKSVLPEPLPSEPAPIDDTIVVTGRLPTITPPPIPGFGTAISAIIPGALNAAQTGGTPPKKDGVLGTGLTLPQLLAIGGVGGDLLGSLFGGSGGGGAGTPYVSPFGRGVGFGAGQDMRANPNILDYERYGFGPEAMFFRPEYSRMISGAGAGAGATTPMYQSMVGQNTQSYQQPAMLPTLAPYSTNEELSKNLLDQVANYVGPNGFSYRTGTVPQTPEWDKLYLDYVTGRSQTKPPRLAGFTQEELDRRLQAGIERGPDIAQQTVDYWSAVRGDPRYASAAQYEMTTGESAGGGPYLPQGYEMVGNAVLKTGTPQYQAAIQGLLPANAPTQAPPAMTINPAYMPLI